jgi:hypothetical protein
VRETGIKVMLERRYSRGSWRWACVLLGTGAVLSGAPTITLRLLDESGAPTAARLRILDPQGRPQPVQSAGPRDLVAAHPNFPELGAIVRGQAQVRLSAGSQTLLLDRGPEYRRASLPVEAREDEALERTVRLERWIHMKEIGWWSGDLHVHRAPADLPVLMQAADIHFAPTLTCWNDTLTLNPWPEKVASTEVPDHAFSVDNCEDERPWGAALFLGVKSPMRLYPRDAQYPPPTSTWGEARSRNAFIDLEKLIWWEAPMMAALNPPDSIGVAVNHFREDGISTRASLSRPRDENRYPGEAGFGKYILDLYSTYLSAGFRIPASAGSANGVVKVPFGYNRSYVYLGKQFSHQDWLAGQKAGRNFVTNGPMLFVTVDEQMPGVMLSENETQARVRVEASSAFELDRVEVLVDGQVAETLIPSGDHSRLTASVSVSVSRGSWLAVRCFEKSDVTIRLAHTSPFYVGKSARRSEESLEYLREWVKADMARIEGVSDDKLSPAQKKELLELSRKALAFYQRN